VDVVWSLIRVLGVDIEAPGPIREEGTSPRIRGSNTTISTGAILLLLFFLITLRPRFERYSNSMKNNTNPILGHDFRCPL